MSQPPPPVPPDSKPQPPPLPTPKKSGGGMDFERFCDTVIGPNVRAKDNLYQGLAVAGFTVIGTASGWWKTRSSGDTLGGVLLGAFCGIVAGALISGGVLMILGFVRKR